MRRRSITLCPLRCPIGHCPHRGYQHAGLCEGSIFSSLLPRACAAWLLIFCPLRGLSCIYAGHAVFRLLPVVGRWKIYRKCWPACWGVTLRGYGSCVWRIYCPFLPLLWTRDLLSGAVAGEDDARSWMRNLRSSPRGNCFLHVIGGGVRAKNDCSISAGR